MLTLKKIFLLNLNLYYFQQKRKQSFAFKVHIFTTALLNALLALCLLCCASCCHAVLIKSLQMKASFPQS